MDFEFHGDASAAVFLRHTSGIHLDPRRCAPLELTLDINGHWITEDHLKRNLEIHGNPWKLHGNYMEIWQKPYEAEKLQHTWGAVLLSNGSSSFHLSLKSSCYAFALADFWVAHQYDRFDLAF